MKKAQYVYKQFGGGLFLCKVVIQYVHRTLFVLA